MYALLWTKLVVHYVVTVSQSLLRSFSLRRIDLCWHFCKLLCNALSFTLSLWKKSWLQMWSSWQMLTMTSPIWKHPWNLKDAQDGPVRTNCMRPNFVQTSRTLFFILVEILWCPRISYILGINISPCGHQISEWLAVSVCIYIFII